MGNNVDLKVRPVVKVIRGQAASDGAGVKLTRVIGAHALPELDPFLLLDEFRSDDANDYAAGFPDHPHRGFETVTYMLAGRMRHGDNHGNVGLLKPGQRAMDDRRARNRAFGNARAGERPHVGIPALGESAGKRQNDCAALPGHCAREDSGS